MAFNMLFGEELDLQNGSSGSSDSSSDSSDDDLSDIELQGGWYWDSRKEPLEVKFSNHDDICTRNDCQCTSLPASCLALVFTFLPFYSLVACEQVCKYWCVLSRIRNYRLWKNLCICQFKEGHLQHMEDLYEKHGTYKNVYAVMVKQMRKVPVMYTTSVTARATRALLERNLNERQRGIQYSTEQHADGKSHDHASLYDPAAVLDELTRDPLVLFQNMRGLEVHGNNRCFPLLQAVLKTRNIKFIRMITQLPVLNEPGGYATRILQNFWIKLSPWVMAIEESDQGLFTVCLESLQRPPHALADYLVQMMRIVRFNLRSGGYHHNLQYKNIDESVCQTIDWLLQWLLDSGLDKQDALHVLMNRTPARRTSLHLNGDLFYTAANSSLLQLACATGSVKIVKKVHEVFGKYQNVHYVDDYGRNALTSALTGCGFGYIEPYILPSLEIVQMLLAWGCKAIVSKIGFNVLQHVVFSSVAFIHGANRVSYSCAKYSDCTYNTRTKHCPNWKQCMKIGVLLIDTFPELTNSIEWVSQPQVDVSNMGWPGWLYHKVANQQHYSASVEGVESMESLLSLVIGLRMEGSRFVVNNHPDNLLIEHKHNPLLAKLMALGAQFEMVGAGMWSHMALNVNLTRYHDDDQLDPLRIPTYLFTNGVSIDIKDSLYHNTPLHMMVTLPFMRRVNIHYSSAFTHYQKRGLAIKYYMNKWNMSMKALNKQNDTVLGALLRVITHHEYEHFHVLVLLKTIFWVYDSEDNVNEFYDLLEPCEGKNYAALKACTPVWVLLVACMLQKHPIIEAFWRSDPDPEEDIDVTEFHRDFVKQFSLGTSEMQVQDALEQWQVDVVEYDTANGEQQAAMEALHRPNPTLTWLQDKLKGQDITKLLTRS